MKDGLFIGGLAIAALGAGVPIILPNIPTTLPAPVTSFGSWIIANQSYIVLLGVALLLVSVFVR